MSQNPQLVLIRVERRRQRVGAVLIDDVSGWYGAFGGVPLGVASDIAVALFAENVAFGEWGDYRWSEAADE